MKCQNCGKIFKGNYCPDCGTKAAEQNNLPQEENTEVIIEEDKSESFFHIRLMDRLKMMLYLLPAAAIMMALFSFEEDTLGAGILFLISGMILAFSLSKKIISRKRIFRRCVGLIIFVAAYLTMAGRIENKEENIETIKKLLQITSLENDQTNEVLNFISNDNWILRYVEENEIIVFEDIEILDRLEAYIGTKDIGNEGKFIYDFSDKCFRIYTSYKTEKDTLYSIQYNTISGKYSVMMKDGWCGASEDFIKYLEDNKVVDFMMEKYKAFESTLTDYYLTITDVSSLNYKMIEICLDESVIKQVNAEKADNKVAAIREGTFTSYSSETIGTAFEEFFAIPKWTYVGANSTDKEYVKFIGICRIYDEDTQIETRFYFNSDDSFRMSYLSFDDEIQTEYEINVLLSAIFEPYMNEIETDTSNNANVDNCRLVNDETYGLCLEVTYSFVNYSNKANAFVWLYDAYVFQNGIACTEHYFFTGDDSKNIAAGAQYTFTERYILENSTDDIVISVTSVSWSDDHTNLSINIPMNELQNGNVYQIS